MRMIVIQCEVCTNSCRGGAYEIQSLPDSWVTLIQTHKDDLHYCSRNCLLTSLQSPLTQTLPIRMPLLTSKTRRFLLVDGETADEREGIKWSNGCVSLDPGKGKTDDIWSHSNWDNLKEHYPGCGVTWIDQEASADVN